MSAKGMCYNLLCMFQSFQSFLALLFACLTVYALIRALRLDSVLAPVRDYWRGLGRTGKAFAFCAVALLAGYAVSKAPIRSPKPPQLIPEWFTALGYDIQM